MSFAWYCRSSFNGVLRCSAEKITSCALLLIFQYTSTQEKISSHTYLHSHFKEEIDYLVFNEPEQCGDRHMYVYTQHCVRVPSCL